jgi:hypothetical protein
MMASLKDWKELIIEYGVVVFIVGASAGGLGYAIGQVEHEYWRKKAETAALQAKDRSDERDKAVAALAPAITDANTLRGELAELREKLTAASAALQEREKATAVAQASLNSKSLDVDRLTRENAALKRQTAGRTPPPPKPEVTGYTFIKTLYRDGTKCIFRFVSDLGVATGFVQSQLEKLAASGIIESVSGGTSDLNCVHLTSAGRAFAEQNGLD